MYINPFWVGVAATIFAELAVVIIGAIWYSKKSGGNQGNDKQH